jgi:dephospho-CoA kinase
MYRKVPFSIHVGCDMYRKVLFSIHIMYVWAITGGVACGKSTVCKMFAACGATVHSADTDAQVVRELPTVQAQLLETFCTTEKADLAKIIYSDETARKKLQALLHPGVREKMQAVIQAARANKANGLVLYEVPLLFEGGLETWFDGVITITTSPEKQIARLQARQRSKKQPELTPEEIQKRLRSQLPLEEKARRANYIISTDVSLDETQARVEEVYARVLF